ncbi:NmrA domain-containing protein [Favolaschia claudopus]|uniref:NmrA domain-containing protein n=1 Tax=Favolaschia claudopus TaxID=2862362 RepID=A0AAW0EJY9_9AGAR
MTITPENHSAPLVAVVGATGKQGGSVIQALAASHKSYRVRGFTRDATKLAAQELRKLGVEVVQVAFVVDNKAEVDEAFSGVDFAFLVTNFWEHFSLAREVAEGKLMIDAAKASRVSGIMWSGLPSFTKLSVGKYTNVYHFDGKALVTEYGRQSGVPFVDVQAGFYGTNFLASPHAPVKRASEFVLALPMKASTVVPFLDADRDYGLFVRYVLELETFPDGAEFVAYSEKLTMQELVDRWARATGKNIKYEQPSMEEFKQKFEDANLPPHILLDMVEALSGWDEFGCQ